MQAKRIAVVEHDQEYPKNPGEYCGPIEEHELGDGNRTYNGQVTGRYSYGVRQFLGKSLGRYVYFLVPKPGDVSCLRLKEGRWTFKEENDGTLTISPSINVEGKWHGYLKKGIWSDV
jgi:hypothetical protein